MRSSGLAETNQFLVVKMNLVQILTKNGNIPMHRCLIGRILGGILPALVLAADGHAVANKNEDLARQVARLVELLNDDRAEVRDRAESELMELAGATMAESDRFLELLPQVNEQMPLAVRDRLSRIRHQIDDRVAKAAVQSSAITLLADQAPLSDVLIAIEQQTGNRLVDKRENNVAAKSHITVKFENEPFWPAVDRILDQAQLDTYSYGDDEALSLVSRSAEAIPRYGRASYSGPFRIELLEIQAQRNLRQPQLSLLKVQMEVAWEPRLRPIAISQPASEAVITTDDGRNLGISHPQAVLEVEVPAGTQAAEMILPFMPPPREAKRITSLRGKMQALVPGRQVQFRFGDLANAAGKSQRRGGVQVSVDDVRKNNDVWEIHMRLALEEDNHALQSHRGWVFQNTAYLVTNNGDRIESAGLETTRQTRNEVGIAYLYDLSNGIEGLTWVYETPAAIVKLPVEYELKEIELP